MRGPGDVQGLRSVRPFTVTLIRARLAPALCLLLFVTATAHAESRGSIPNPRVANGTWVTDTAAALSPKTLRMCW